MIKFFTYLNDFFIYLIYYESAKLAPRLLEERVSTISFRVEKVFCVEILKLVKSWWVALEDFSRSENSKNFNASYFSEKH